MVEDRETPFGTIALPEGWPVSAIFQFQPPSPTSGPQTQVSLTGFAVGPTDDERAIAEQQRAQVESAGPVADAEVVDFAHPALGAVPLLRYRFEAAPGEHVTQWQLFFRQNEELVCMSLTGPAAPEEFQQIAESYRLPVRAPTA